MTVTVRNLQVLRDFRAKLIRFAEEIEAVLLSIQSETQHAFEWIEQDRPRYWTVQQRKAFDLVASTRAAFHTCQMKTIGGRRSSCIEEKQAFEKAKRRLGQTQEQLEKVRRWSVQIHHDVDEFRGRINLLRRLLDVEIPQAMAMLEQATAILENYAELNPPPPSAS